MSKGKVNKTSLDVETANERGLVHRDYIAHCLRWNYVLKVMKRGMSVLDLGCGDGMLSQVLYANKYKPKLYVGLDIRQSMVEKMMKRPANFSKIGICNDIRTGTIGHADGNFKGFFDLVVCFELIEHFEEKYLDHVLQEIGLVLKPSTGLLMLSTPNYDGVHKAGNHIHEYTERELEEAFRENYYVIEKKIGTFASQKDIVPAMSVYERSVFERLRPWMDSNILSVIFASLHPSQSRNILWVCRPI